MSIRAMSAVWQDSLARGNNRLVLLAIADAASGDDGSGAILHQDTLAQKAGLSVRTVQRSIAQLIADDELRVDRESTRVGNSYTVVAAWKRAVQVAASGPNLDRRQVDVSGVKDAAEHAELGGKHDDSPAGRSTDDKLTSLTEQGSQEDSDRGDCDTGVNLTRQTGGGKKDTPANVGVSDTPTGGAPDPFLIRSLPARATDDKLTCAPTARQQGSIIPRGGGGSIAWSKQMDRQHASCHPEVCNWRDSKVRQCMPLALVDTYARKLTALQPDAAIANVIAWARTDTPPEGYVAAGDIYAHWRLRWDLTRATAPSVRAASAKSVETLRVPGAAETDALIEELTAGRVRS